MPKTFVESAIDINAPVSRVWGMFVDRDFTNEMGGEYVSDWKVGSSLQWRTSGGRVLTKGVILKIEPEKILQHSLFSSPDSSSVLATLTYQLDEKDGRTEVRVREDFTNPITDQEHADSAEGWNAAMTGVKAIAERLQKG